MSLILRRCFSVYLRGLDKYQLSGTEMAYRHALNLYNDEERAYENSLSEKKKEANQKQLADSEEAEYENRMSGLHAICFSK